MSAGWNRRSLKWQVMVDISLFFFFSSCCNRSSTCFKKEEVAINWLTLLRMSESTLSLGWFPLCTFGELASASLLPPLSYSVML